MNLANMRSALWLSHIQFFVTSWTVAHQAPLSMGFFRQEYWSGSPFSSIRDLPNPHIEPTSPVSSALQADSLPTEPSRKRTIRREVLNMCMNTGTNTHTHTHTHCGSGGEGDKILLSEGIVWGSGSLAKRGIRVAHLVKLSRRKSQQQFVTTQHWQNSCKSDPKGRIK